MKTMGIIGGVVLVVIGLLWLGFSGAGGGGDGEPKPEPVPPWDGVMAVSTGVVTVKYDGRSVRCLANDVSSPQHFSIFVANYGDEPLVCDVQVVEEDIGASHKGDAAWLQMPEIPVIPAQRAGGIPIRVNLPQNLPDGQYSLKVVVSKNTQAIEVPVMFEIARKQTA